MGRGFRRLAALLTGLAFISGMSLSAAEPTVTIEPYTEDEFPGWLQDVRRAEIVSLGSLPFVTLGVTLGYSLYRYFSNDMNPDYFPNPFAKSSSAARLSTDEQLGILFTSLGLAAVVGIADFTVSSIQRYQREKAEIRQNSEGVEIVPLDDAADASAVEEEMADPSRLGAAGGTGRENREEIRLARSMRREFPPFGLSVPMPERELWSVP